MDKNRDQIVEELISLIEKGGAHATFGDAVEGVSLELLNVIPDNLPYSIWQLIEHIRITQWDIVEFCIDKNHTSPKWPDEYWPEATEEKISEQQLKASLKQISADREKFFGLLKNPVNDLFKPFPYGEGQTLLREALLIADHNAYHMGEIIVVRRLLNDWKS